MLTEINQLNVEIRLFFNETTVTYNFLKYNKINNNYILQLGIKKINNERNDIIMIYFLNSIGNNIYTYMDLYFIVGKTEINRSIFKFLIFKNYR